MRKPERTFRRLEQRQLLHRTLRMAPANRSRRARSLLVEALEDRTLLSMNTVSWNEVSTDVFIEHAAQIVFSGGEGNVPDVKLLAQLRFLVASPGCAEPATRVELLAGPSGCRSPIAIFRRHASRGAERANVERRTRRETETGAEARSCRPIEQPLDARPYQPPMGQPTKKLVEETPLIPSGRGPDPGR